MRPRPLPLAAVLAAALALPSLMTGQDVVPDSAATTAPEDPFLWLEEVEGERALEWVTDRSEATFSELSGDAVFDSIRSEALAILESDERIPYPSIVGESIYNLWQDADHERGIWRRTSWDSYLSGDPEWETVLDIDALAAEEDVPWAFQGAECLPPERRLCMVRLSRGGADAAQAREFDLVAKAFVEGGFFVPEAKGSVTWLSEDELLLSSDFGEGTRTTSGYPRIAKRWTRGTPLAEADVVFEGEADDVGVWVGTVETASETIPMVFHSPRFFETRRYVLEADGSLTPIEIPLDAEMTLTDRYLAAVLKSPWETGGRTYPEGALIAIERDRFQGGARDFDVVLEPDDRSTIEGVSRTSDALLVATLEDVRGRLLRYRVVDGAWTAERVRAPDLGSVDVVETDADDPRFFFRYESHLQPGTLYVAEADGAVREVRSMPAMFDAEGLVVEQFRATSKDGTRVPYFVIHRDGIPTRGGHPTLLYGYGGFDISLSPGYDPVVGKAWLERGGVYAVANIRGGGEFGPDWWKAAQRANRQLAYDDFLAVAEDLIARGITAPERLGIHGGSNGGLLVGVAMTQRPDLFDAVVIEVPLLDMRRYNRLLAGASWMAEYGDPDVPEEWAWIREYSPYQNLEPDADYPVPLLYTTTRDDRVHPGHARKMAAKMASMGHEVLYYENTEGGHGRAVTPAQRARMYALMYTYMLRRLADQDGEVARVEPTGEGAGVAPERGAPHDPGGGTRSAGNP